MPETIEEQELHLLDEWRVPGEGRRVLGAGVLSILVHAGFFLLLLSLPREAFLPPHHPASRLVFTPLIAPPRELTQTAPNKGKIGHEFTLENLVPHPAVLPRVSPPSSTHAAAPVAAPRAPETTASRPVPPVPPPQIQPPPSIQMGPDRTAQAPALGTLPNAPPPPPPANEKPKLAFEKPGTSLGAPSGVGAGGGIPKPPDVRDMIRNPSPGSARGGVVVGDLGEGIGGIGGNPNLPPSPPKMGSSLELMSDPLGIDFRPYLVRVLATVRRNWMAVIPEAARLGLRGKVVLQFAIRRDGRVTKVVFASEAGPGAQALDRAAVASISASDPFPPLPVEFHGDQVRLQLAFLYNQPSRP